MMNCEHVRQGAAVLRFYPTIWIFVIGVTYADVAVDDVLHNDIAIFLGVFGYLPLRPIHLQVSDSVTVQDAIGLVRAYEAKMPVFVHDPLL